MEQTKHFQYLHYDSKQKKLASKSKIIASFREEAIDTNGTVRCGKPVSSQLRDNPELKERWADVTCFRQVRGLVSGKGKTVDGETVTAIDLSLSSLSYAKRKTEELGITKSEANKAEWRAYSLSGQERGDDGLPKAFTRHSEKKDIYRKPRKGNRRGGVHKTGGLHLGGWTEEDSNREYKKKVEGNL